MALAQQVAEYVALIAEEWKDSEIHAYQILGIDRRVYTDNTGDKWSDSGDSIQRTLDMRISTISKMIESFSFTLRLSQDDKFTKTRSKIFHHTPDNEQRQSSFMKSMYDERIAGLERENARKDKHIEMLSAQNADLLRQMISAAGDVRSSAKLPIELSKQVVDMQMNSVKVYEAAANERIDAHKKIIESDQNNNPLAHAHAQVMIDQNSPLNRLIENILPMLIGGVVVPAALTKFGISGDQASQYAGAINMLKGLADTMLTAGDGKPVEAPGGLLADLPDLP